MVQQALGGIAADFCLDVSQAKSTFDRLLRAYFARFAVGEPPVIGDVSHALELPLADCCASSLPARKTYLVTTPETTCDPIGLALQLSQASSDA